MLAANVWVLGWGTGERSLAYLHIPLPEDWKIELDISQQLSRFTDIVAFMCISVHYNNIKLTGYSCASLLNYYGIYCLFTPLVYLVAFGVARLALWNGRPTRHLWEPNRTKWWLHSRTPDFSFCITVKAYLYILPNDWTIKLDLTQQLSRLLDIIGFVYIHNGL